MQTHIHANIYTFYTHAQIIYVFHSRVRKNNLVNYISDHSWTVLLKTGMREDNATPQVSTALLNHLLLAALGLVRVVMHLTALLLSGLSCTNLDLEVRLT